MPVRTPLPPAFRQHPPEPPPPVPTSTPTARPEPDEESRMMPRGLRGYRVKPADLRFYAGQCPACGGSAPRLSFAIPAGYEYPILENVAGYTAYFEPRACSGCELRAIVARLFPPLSGPAIADPNAEELQRLRAELTRAPEAATTPETEGGLFPLGRVLITEGAGRALHFSHVGHRRDGAVGGIHVSGFAHAPALLARHQSGDFGACGSFQDGDADLGALMNPLATPADRNAASIKDGRGSVVTIYRVGFEDVRPDPANYNIPRLMHKCDYHIRVRTELGGRVPLTLVGLADEF